MGIEPAALQSLKERLQNTSQTNSQHIGLTNVHMRIRLLYGAPYGISIDSGLGEGTKITIRLKKINEKGEFF